MSGPHPPGRGAFGDEPGERTSHDQPVPDAQVTSDTGFSQAYSAPESEQFTSGPYIPADPSLYDYDSYEGAPQFEDAVPPRWPWVVGVTAILAAIALVVSVSLLVTRTDTTDLANPGTTTTTVPPVQDEITTPPPPSSPPPPPPSPTEPPPTHTETVTVTPETPPPPPPPETTTAEVPPPPSPPPATTTAEAPPPSTTATTAAQAAPRQITYSVTGTKAPGDVISITYVDASGRSRTQRNVYIPWSLTVTPISQSEVGSVEASSLFLVSRLNCSITSSDGTVLSANSSNASRTRC